MKTLQKIYDKLNSKPELAKHEVNLTALTEINQLTAYITKEHALLVKNSSRYVEMTQETKEFYKKEVFAKGYSLRNFLKENYDKALVNYTAKLKELGIQEEDNDALIEWRRLYMKLREDLNERSSSNFWWIGTIK